MSDELSLEKRIRMFYTGEGIVGKSALELGLEQLEPFDNLIEQYEEQGLFEPDLFRLPVVITEALYKVMDEYYHGFYNELKKKGNKEMLGELIAYHHDVVSTLTEEIITRKKRYFEARGKYFRRKNETQTMSMIRLRGCTSRTGKCGRMSWVMEMMSDKEYAYFKKDIEVFIKEVMEKYHLDFETAKHSIEREIGLYEMI